MSGRVVLGRTSTKQWIKCLAQGHSSDSASGEARTSNPSIPSLTLYKLYHFTPQTSFCYVSLSYSFSPSRMVCKHSFYISKLYVQKAAVIPSKNERIKSKKAHAHNHARERKPAMFQEIRMNQELQTHYL